MRQADVPTYRKAVRGYASTTRDDDLVGRVEGLRYRATDTGAEETLWRGRFWDYGPSEDGVRVPQRGEVAWVLAGGEQPYWRGRLEGVKSVLKRRA